ncbi:LptA/OstA family protein [Fuchsiella alkaliacetigena]|uniref:LptA/OstA family protein n=1 Tax=Fuchsiella alkaliacetigena TaxID=957042 RepID=UPI00200A908D|nr:LptA/OstA family protein [Fuchsiella alkaliacetigena]MCK8824283.1 hypothetical protein [Fuchsiella alkaliacetigena]
MTVKNTKLGFSLVLLLGILFLLAAGVGAGNNEGSIEDIEIWADEMTIEEDKLIAEGNVVIYSPQGEMRGAYFEADNISETGVLSGDPVWENEAGWVVTGSKFEIDFAKQELFIPERANVESEQVVADSQQLHYFRARNEVILTGEVEVTNQQRRLTGEQVVIDLETERMTSSGSSRLLLPRRDVETEDDQE